jgi:oligopeptidase B
MTTPTSDLGAGCGQRRARTLLKRDEVPGGFDPETTSPGATGPRPVTARRVPVSILHHRDTPLDGTAPLYQYAYGSYGHSSDPTFNTGRLSLVDRGFVFAIAHVRGGQEMGRHWYDQGRMLNKRNTFTTLLT